MPPATWDRVTLGTFHCASPSAPEVSTQDAVFFHPSIAPSHMKSASDPNGSSGLNVANAVPFP